VYDLGSVRANIEALMRACEEAAAAVEFITASELPALLSARS